MPNAPRLPALLLAAALAACGSTVPQRPIPGPPAAAPPDWLLQAERALTSGNGSAASQALARIDPSVLPNAQAVRFQTAQARVLLLEGKPELALQALPAPWATGDRQLAAEVEATRAEALMQLGDTVAAVAAMVQRESFLDLPAQREANHEKTWALLQQAQLGSGIDRQLASADTVTRGWIELARIARNSGGMPPPNPLADWRVRHPNHPAELALLDPRRHSAGWQPAGGPLERVALLLPLSGRFAVPAEAVREGFFDAWLQTPRPRPSVQVFDTGDQAHGLQTALQNAVASGAQFVVGPLQKDHVAQLAARGTPVPALALNYLDSVQLAPMQFYQFGLAPEDEARQAATRAAAQGQLRAVVMVPEGGWGDRVYTAFADRLTELGGRVMHLRRIGSHQSDFSEQIQDLLGLRESRARNNALRGIIGYQTEFETRPRSNIDFAFIAAGPTQARSIRAQFRYFHAASLPIYATSIAYDGVRDATGDLEGLHFCDMPWVLDDGGRWTALKTRLQPSLTPNLRAQTRLIALGYDAYLLAEAIQNGQLASGGKLDGGTGVLSLDAANTVRRELRCAVVGRNGLRMLPAASGPAAGLARPATEWR